jgi:hypothetical protein
MTKRLSLLLSLLLLCIAACVAPVTLPPKGAMPAGATWAGKWDTRWGPLELTQANAAVQGKYQYGSVRGTLTGTADGNYLEFDWREEEGGAGTGQGMFVMQADGKSFAGGWGVHDRTGSGSWDGTRVGDAPAATTPVTVPGAPAAAPQASPAAGAATPPAGGPSPAADGVATCAADRDCPGGTFCKASRCTAECSADSHCPASSRCDASVGRCVPR